MTDKRLNSVRLDVMHLILGCRDVAKGEKAKRTILDQKVR